MEDKVQLNAFELQFLCTVAHGRNCVKEPYGVRNRRCDPQSDFSVHLHGVMGEYAAAKVLGGKVDQSVSPAGDDKISDLVINDTKIQVKTNMGRWKKVHLYFNSPDLFRADVAVLATIQSATEIGLNGWISRERFLREAEKKNFGYGDRWAVRAEDLAPMNSLLETLS